MPSALKIGLRQWNGEINRVWGVTSAIEAVISQLDLSRPNALPDVRSGSTLLLASDYGGQHRAASHITFSFLLADLLFCHEWNSARNTVRQRFLKDKRRMCYKALNDKQRRAALRPFLLAADGLCGLLVTFLVEKKFASRIAVGEGTDRDALPPTMRTWSSALIQKFVWVTHLGSVIVAGLSAKGQSLIWLTDEDEIAANDKRTIEVTPLVMQVLSNYLTHDMGHLKFGTTRCDNGDLFIEDFAAIPDLAAGALADIPLWSVQKKAAVVSPLHGHIPSKSLNILAWLGNTVNEGLHKIALVIDQGDLSDQVKVRALTLSTTE